LKAVELLLGWGVNLGIEDSPMTMALNLARSDIRKVLVDAIESRKSSLETPGSGPLKTPGGGIRL
jgi:hypothetical protein